MQSKLIEKVYAYSWPKDSMRRATIVFKVEDDNLVFSHCRFCGVGTIYSLDDWEFLRDLADEILILAKGE